MNKYPLEWQLKNSHHTTERSKSIQSVEMMLKKKCQRWNNVYIITISYKMVNKTVFYN